MNRCITCGTRLNRNKAHIKIIYMAEEYLVCCPLCQAAFEREPEKFVRAKRLNKTH
jgi:YHS domain-containing protein